MVKRNKPSPIISVTITPAGQCVRQAEEAARILARELGRDIKFHPHITLQVVYNEIDTTALEKAIGALCARLAPFELEVGGAGFLPSSSNPSRLHLLLKVDKTPTLANLYTALRECLISIGAETYPYTVEEWVPHLTLTYGEFPHGIRPYLAAQLEAAFASCSFVARGLTLNRLEAPDKWTTIRNCKFLSPCPAGLPEEEEPVCPEAVECEMEINELVEQRKTD
jgi:2'-5' RNA ligase